MSGTRSRSAGASSTYDCSRSSELLLAEMQQRRVPFEQHDRVVRRSRRRSARGAARDPLRVGDRVDDPRRELRARAASIAGSPADGARTSAVDDRQVELRVLRTELVDHHAAAVDADTAGCPAGTGRSAAARDTNTSTVDGSTRRSATSATHGDSRSRRRYAARSAVRMLVPRRPSTSACTSPADSRTLPCTAIRCTCSVEALTTRSTAR